LCSLRCEECGDVYDIASPVRRASFLSCHLVCQSFSLIIDKCSSFLNFS
jgi:hypothetical protein